jgi:hypothetical protein
MSDTIDDFFTGKGVKDLQGTLGTALDVASSAVAIISGVGALVGGVGVILDLFFEKTDQLKEIVNVLSAKFDVVYQLISAEHDVVTLQNITDQLEKARTQLFVLREFPQGTPNFEAQRGAVLNESAEAVNTLGNPDFWKRPFFEQGIYRDGWAGSLPPPGVKPGTVPLVFDYRLVMPAYLETIVIRLAILSALMPDYRRTNAPELDLMAERLERFHQTIMHGMVTLRPPTFDETLYHALVLSIESTWNQRLVPPGQLYGAVDTYSAASDVASWSGARFPNPLTNPAPESSQLFDADRQHRDYQKFLAQHEIGTRARWATLYHTIGMSTLWTIRNQLRDLTSHQKGDRTDPGNWSLRWLDERVAANITGGVTTATDGERVDVRKLLTMVDIVPDPMDISQTRALPLDFHL